jgi:thiamine biosynthesis lipoprotein
MIGGKDRGGRLARTLCATESQLLVTLALALLAPLAQAATHTERARFLMGTTCQLRIVGSPADADVAFREISRIETFLSTWSETSELSRLNSNPHSVVSLSPELARLLRRSLELSSETRGTFNPLLRPLIDLWKSRDEGALPASAKVAEALALTRVGAVKVDADGSIERPPGVRFEEGGFGKGYAIDRALELLAARDVDCATIDFGGQIATRGCATEVAVADPVERETAALTLTLRDASISTSSGSEKQFEIARRRFSHILDPRTGEALPPRGSVSVIHPSAFEADVFSTALYVMGPDEALQFANDRNLAVIFIVPADSDSSYEVLRSDAARRLEVLSTNPSKYRLKDDSR